MSSSPFTDERDSYTVIDRSDLERYAVCPAQARFVATGAVKSVGIIAEAGEQVHQALGRALRSYMDSQGMLSPQDIRNVAETCLREARPDVQPDALRAFSKSVWAWVRFISDIHYHNILRFDSGEGERSGQLAWDIDHLKLRVTSELDLLHSTASPALLAEVDYKTGNATYTEQDVRDSFQFQLHAQLVLHNYPDVEALRVTVWNTRRNVRTYPVVFTRESLHAIQTRILSTAGEWYRNRALAPEKAATWPARDKCDICDAAAFCPVADRDIRGIATDPVAFVDEMHAVETKLKKMKKLAGQYVDKNGEILTPSGNAYGVKPRTTKPSKTLYALKQETTDGDGDGNSDGE